MRAISRPEALTPYLAKELGADGIVVSTVAPGAVASDFRGRMVRDNPEVKKRHRHGDVGYRKRKQTERK